MSVGRDMINGRTGSNGVSQVKSPLPHTNGTVNAGASKGPAEQASSIKQPEKKAVATNGMMARANVSQPTAGLEMDKLPEEILEMLRRIPDDVYVPMSRLVDRAARSCWSDLSNLLHDLAKMQIRPPTEVTDRIVGEQNTPNDTSESNRKKKYMMWNFAENHKRALIKLLVILQWSAKTDENKATIALNFYLHELRSSFLNASDMMSKWIEWINSRQDASPDLDTAAEILTAGRIATLPDLGYIDEQEMTPKQMLSTIRRLNTVLNIRMMAEDGIPVPLSNWRIHDGRVTFSVRHEFDLALSVMEEDLDSKFRTVDVSFNFWPAPAISQSLHDEILIITNNQLLEKGLEGAYRFLHDLTLSQKLKELHRQALDLARGLWLGHLHVEMLKRTLIVQYWARRPASKSWIEITINSGRIDRSGEVAEYPIPYLNLRWMRNGKLVSENEINMDLVHLSFDSILNQVVAYHTNSIFDAIYDKLLLTPLFTSNALDLEQSSSLVDGHDCGLSIELSKMESIQLALDPVGGTMVISPASERTNRLQSELTRSKNLVDDFSSKFPALRCGIAQAILTRAISASSWQNLPGRKPSLNEVRELLSASTLRAAFFRQPGWSESWMLAASFGADGDLWWLVYEPDTGRRIVQPLPLGPTHLQRSFSFDYFEALAKQTAAMITLQVNQRSVRELGLGNILPEARRPEDTYMKVQLDKKENFTSVNQDIIVSFWSSKRASSEYVLVVLAGLIASKETLSRLASAGLDQSITVRPGKRLLQLRLPCAVGEVKMDTMLARLHYIDDLINCIKLVHDSKTLKMQRLTLQEIVIDYHIRESSNLGLALLFESTDSQSKVRLLPEGNSPHCLISEHVGPALSRGQGPLSERLSALLATLRFTLPLVNCLQYLQGLTDAQEVPEMASLKLEESRKWLRIHVMSRDMVRFGLHFFTTNSAFKHDVDGPETPENMLVRLEIEPQASGGASKLGWIVRPAVEEFKTYTRPSFTSQALRERLKETIWTSKDTNWIGMDNAAKCQVTEPHHLIIALHNNILDWLQQAVTKQAEVPAGKQSLQNSTPAAGGKQNNASNTNQNQTVQNKQQVQPNQGKQIQQPQTNKQQLPQAQPNKSQVQQPQPNQNRPQIPSSQHGMQAFQHGRPGNMGMNMNQNSNMGMNMNVNGTSRVMTAPPQQVRQQPTNVQQQRRPGQNPNIQNRGNNQGQRTQPNPRDVINLD